MGLTCALAPLVYAELYALLAAEHAYRELLDERLRSIDLDATWLDEATAEYRAKAEAQFSELGCDGSLRSPDWGLNHEHAQLATWVLSALRSEGPSMGFSADLTKAVATCVAVRTPNLAHRLPNCLRPSVICWTLGMVASERDSTFPVVLAHEPADPDVTLAYHGMVEHVAHLLEQPEPWPEMLGTAILWRTTALAEGLRPQQSRIDTSIRVLMSEIRALMPDYTWQELNSHWIGFVDRRNVLSHVARIAGKPAFSECVSAASTWSDVRPTVLGLTHFVAQEVSAQLEAAGPGLVQAGSWDRIRWDLFVPETGTYA